MIWLGLFDKQIVFVFVIFLDSVSDLSYPRSIEPTIIVLAIVLIDFHRILISLFTLAWLYLTVGLW